MNRRTLIVAAALGAGAFAAGFVASRWQGSATPSTDRQSSEAEGTAAASRPGAASSGGPGNEAPDFGFVDQHGEEHRFSDWQGAARVVNFWGTWCPPCVHEIPILIALQESFSDDGVQFVGVAVDDPDSAFAMAREMGMNYPTMADSRRSLDLLRAYGNRTSALPFTAFVDPDGLIQDRYAGALTEEQAREKIRALLS